MTYETLDQMIEDAAFGPEIESRCGVRLSVFLKANGQAQFVLCGADVPEGTAMANFDYIRRRQ